MEIEKFFSPYIQMEKEKENRSFIKIRFTIVSNFFEGELHSKIEEEMIHGSLELRN